MDKLTLYNNNTPYFSLIGKEMHCRVLDIYDGDTLTVVLNIFEQYFKFTIRLCGIDTCELKSCSEQNKHLAIKARNRLFELITGSNYESHDFKSKNDVKRYFDSSVSIIWIQCQEFDKYGRLLANLFKTQGDELSFSDTLIRENLAYAYLGDKKLTETEQLEKLQKDETDDSN